MNSSNKCYQKYIPLSVSSLSCPLNCTTAGYQIIEKGENYPLLNHPFDYSLVKRRGRILNEYQILYITEGKGSFASQSLGKEVEITAGTFIMLFPGEWHNYYPDKEIGWKEYWIGFRCNDEAFPASYGFSKNFPVIRIGHHSAVSALFEESCNAVEQEKSGMQIYLSGIIMHILGLVNYLNKNITSDASALTAKIRNAQLLLKERCEENLSVQDLASELGMGYTWFRRKFKQYAGVSPGQYLLQQKHLRAKELLINSSLSISEIGFRLGFENMSQFSTFFKKFEGLSASSYRINNVFNISEAMEEE